MIYDILSVIQRQGNAVKPTPLMRYANLSTQRFAEYIEELLEKGLVVEQSDKKDRKFYSLSDRGFEYLQKYSLIQGFIDEFDL